MLNVNSLVLFVVLITLQRYKVFGSNDIFRNIISCFNDFALQIRVCVAKKRRQDYLASTNSVFIPLIFCPFKR